MEETNARSGMTQDQVGSVSLQQQVDAQTAAGVKKYGAFTGMFTPTLLTILGVIMYLRFGWVVGKVGLGGTLLIVTLATSITLLTALSIAAIATDQRVRTGGAYYMISRSLGMETGGAVGIPLFLAQAAAPELGVAKGCIVNITDIYGLKPLAAHAAYCAAKAGLIMLTRSLALELAPNVRVNAVVIVVKEIANTGPLKASLEDAFCGCIAVVPKSVVHAKAIVSVVYAVTD